MQPVVPSRRVDCIAILLAFLLTVWGSVPSLVSGAPPAFKPRRVKARVQPRPGAKRRETQMRVYEAPVNLPTVSPDAARLADDDLVLGVVMDGKATAFPVRYLAMFEVVNGQTGQTPVACTW